MFVKDLYEIEWLSGLLLSFWSANFGLLAIGINLSIFRNAETNKSPAFLYYRVNINLSLIKFVYLTNKW